MGLMVVLFGYLHGTMLWTMVQGGTWPGRLFVAGIFLLAGSWAACWGRCSELLDGRAHAVDAGQRSGVGADAPA